MTVGQVHEVVAAVVADGGAVGWLVPPSITEIDEWLREWRTVAESGRGGLILGEHRRRIAAIGGWRAHPTGPLGHVVELSKVMVHPALRGTGLGRAVVAELIERADDFGAELLVLGVRGNNHGAQALYESFGFSVWGVLPNGVAVDRDRFDDVRMFRQLHLPTDVIRHGQRPGGPGGSAHPQR